MTRPLVTHELVMLDDGFGAKLERRIAHATEGEGGVHPCAHCGASTVWIYRRSRIGPASRGQDRAAPPVHMMTWRERPYCTMLCAQRAIRHGGLRLGTERAA